MIFLNKTEIKKEYKTLFEFAEAFNLKHTSEYPLSKEFVNKHKIPSRFLVEKPKKKGALIFGDLDIEVEGADERSSSVLDVASYKTILLDEKDLKKVKDFVRNYIRGSRTLFVFFGEGEGRNRRWKIISV